MEAEIYIRKGMNLEAESAFKLALEASLKKTSSLVTYFEDDDADISEITELQINTFVSAQIADMTLENIMKHKYVSLFSSLEPYNDFRRTGYPSLIPNPNASNNLTSIPLRFPTASTERLHNSNAIVVNDLTSKVWWDVD